MATVELKSNIHRIVDEIQNEQLLRTLYDFLKVKTTSKSGQLWDALTKEERQEILLAYEESEDEANLIDREEVFKRPK